MPKPASQAVVLGRHEEKHSGFVNTPIYRGSTVLFPTLKDFIAGQKLEPMIPGKTTYGRYGTPLSNDLEEAICTLEGGHRGFSVCSGMAAVTTALLAFLKRDDHILMVDSCYHPTRRFCEQALTGFGVDVDFYNPRIGGDIAKLIQHNTRVIFLESPGSLTFEIQDVPAITSVAKQHGITTIIDNTWGTPLHFPSFRHGIDVSVHSATKYIVGHADALLGMILCNEQSTSQVRDAIVLLGQCAAPDDVFLGLRGLRTMPVRLAQHHRHGLEIANWLAEQPEVLAVCHPGRADHSDHPIWKRDFTGANGLFSFTLKPCSMNALAAMLDNLDFFGMGYSFGGYESLLIPTNPASFRSTDYQQANGQLMRIHVGLEDPDDIKRDLRTGLDRLHRVDH